MRGLLAVLVVLVLLVVGVGALGYSQGWFKVSKAQPEQGKSFQVTVDKEKFKADEQRAKEKAQGAAGQIKEKAGRVAGQIKEKAGEISGKGHKEANPPKESDEGRK